MAALLLSACGATVPRVEGGRVEIALVQLSTVPAAARHVSGGSPMQYAVRVGNRTANVITLSRVSIQTVSDGGAYIIAPTSRPYDVKIPPNAFREVEVWAPAQLTGGTISGANGPVSLRLTLQFDSTAGPFQEAVIRQAHAARTSGGD